MQSPNKARLKVQLWHHTIIEKQDGGEAIVFKKEEGTEGHRLGSKHKKYD